MGTKLIDEPGEPRSTKGTALMGGTPTGTRVLGPDGDTAATHAHTHEPEPVVGWLAIIAGPGRGRSVEVSYGMNIIGRGYDNRIQLSFGDESISQDDHFRIAYDGQNREFHLVPGRGTNLVYVAGRPLLAPQALSAGTELTVGGTTLRFIPLCNPAWDWSDQGQS